MGLTQVDLQSISGTVLEHGTPERAQLPEAFFAESSSALPVDVVTLLLQAILSKEGQS